MRFGYPSWSIEASDAWTVTDHPECLTMQLSDDGALQFSSARKQVGAVTEEDLLFGDDRAGWGQHRNVELGPFSGIVYEYEESNAAWARWFLRNGATLLFVTYNGSSQAFEREHREVGKVLASLRVESQGGA